VAQPGADGDLVGFILGSTAHKVIHLTDWPVLIVK
jgi:nucleotide-binding universal stress UspA family protein